MESFKVGDVVKLKSGSSNMTIIDIFDTDKKDMNTLQGKLSNRKKGDVLCEWMDASEMYHKKYFIPEALELVKES